MGSCGKFDSRLSYNSSTLLMSQNGWSGFRMMLAVQGDVSSFVQETGDGSYTVSNHYAVVVILIVPCLQTTGHHQDT